MLRHAGQQPGGIGTYTNNLTRSLLKEDTENKYLLFYQYEKQRGTFPVSSHVKEFVVSAASKMVWDQILIPRLARRGRCNLLFNPKLSVPLLSVCKTVFVMHGADWFVFPENYTLLDRLYHRFFATLYLSRADAVISVSSDATKRLIDFRRVRPDKITTIHHGVDDAFVPEYSQVQRERVCRLYNLPEKFILFVGQLYPMKNLAGIIRGFAGIRDRLPHKLLVVGTPVSKYQKDLALVGKLGLSQDVRFVGRVPDQDLPLFYNLADLFLFPSLYEGFGIPLLEAMASGCPVITSTAGSCPEVVGDAALTVNPHDTTEISEAIFRLAADEALRKDLRRKGLRRVQEFTWTRAAHETLKLFKRVADEREGRKSNDRR